MSFPIERELFHQAPNWDVGSSGRGAELAVLLHHQARAEHRAVDNAGGETLRSALYLFSPHPPRTRKLAHGAVHSEEFTEQGAVLGPEHMCSSRSGSQATEELCILGGVFMRRGQIAFLLVAVSLALPGYYFVQPSEDILSAC